MNRSHSWLARALAVALLTAVAVPAAARCHWEGDSAVLVALTADVSSGRAQGASRVTTQRRVGEPNAAAARASTALGETARPQLTVDARGSPADEPRVRGRASGGRLWFGRKGSKEAAEGGAKVHMGKQGKHIPGHNNYQPGKSILRANPAELAKHAGSGTPVNNVDPNDVVRRERRR